MVRSSLSGTGGESVALLGVEVRAEVVAGHACATVRQRYRNQEAKPIEAIYTFPLPSKAVVTGFSMTVEGRRLEGEVHEKEEAFKRYDDAIAAGHGGALLEQERPNVFTANIGNLLPNEETVIELQYVEPLLADEGAVRWSIPTLVAPRYIPGIASGDRTAHGTADPTDRVPDADRISPPIGDVAYGLELDLTFDLGAGIRIESPSHPIVVTPEGDKTRVRFTQKDVALDRDVVVTAFASTAALGASPIASAVCHRQPKGTTGILAVTLVPDLGSATNEKRRKELAERRVVFVLDRSGSMGGTSMPEARTALRLCLRQLAEGDRFNILAFDESIEAFAPALVPYSQATLQRADAWLTQVDARGGTELLAPMLEAARLAPDGIIVLITDGEVGNEDEILSSFLTARGSARVYSFGIGGSVSDALLHALAEKTDGAVEMIHPGERVDEKVVGQFARATAPRVTDVTIKTRGIELGELAPAEARALVDGEPYCLFATYEEPGRGAIELRGKRDGEAFYLEIPVDLQAESDKPTIEKLWAQARIRDLERASLDGRRAAAMKDRIVKLATTYGVSSKHTSFIVVEKRTGDRRANAQPETRVVPVNAPAGWNLYAPARAGSYSSSSVRAPRPAMGMPARGLSSPAPRRMPAGAQPPPMASRPMAAPASFAPRAASGGGRPPYPLPASAAPEAFAARAEAQDDDDLTMVPTRSMDAPMSMGSPMQQTPITFEPEPSGDPALDVLGRQAASGLWESNGRDAVDVTIEALLSLLRLGLSTTHPMHGAQIKKAVDALLERLAAPLTIINPRTRELALGLAWLLASGRRTRTAIEDAARGTALAASFGNEPAVRALVEQLAP